MNLYKIEARKNVHGIIAPFEEHLNVFVGAYSIIDACKLFQDRYVDYEIIDVFKKEEMFIIDED